MLIKPNNIFNISGLIYNFSLFYLMAGPIVFLINLGIFLIRLIKRRNLQHSPENSYFLALSLGISPLFFISVVPIGIFFSGLFFVAFYWLEKVRNILKYIEIS